MPVELELVIIFNIVSTFILENLEPTHHSGDWMPSIYNLTPGTLSTVQWDSQHDELMGERGTRECFHENTFTKH